MLVEKKREKKTRKKVLHRRNKSSKTKLYRRINIAKFEELYEPLLGKNVTELCKMQLNKCRLRKSHYSSFQKWLAINLYVSTSKLGYRVLKQLFPLPSEATLLRSLKKFQSHPGIHNSTAELLKLKVKPQNFKSRCCMISLDEMSLRTGLKYDMPTGSIVGFENDGKPHSKKLATSAFCVMVNGIFKRYKYPIGYIFSESVMKPSLIIKTIKSSIEVCEKAGLIVKMITSDQGSNFEKTFKQLGVTVDKPFFEVDDKKLYVYRDPPHIIKNARNFLEKSPVHVPNCYGKASWSHLQQLYHLDLENSIRHAHKLTETHLSNLKFGNRMKVKLAVNVLSHTVYAALSFMVASNKLTNEALATAMYCKWWNDIFDALNSLHSKDSVFLRRPLNLKKGQTLKFLGEAKAWLQRLELLNKERKAKFISGCIQNINVLMMFCGDLKEHEDIKFLSTRNLCQDNLEQFFGQIRSKSKFPTPHDFTSAYSRLTVASLVRPPKTGNSEVIENDVDATPNLLDHVSFLHGLRVCKMLIYFLF